jgi:hypothetical protein
MDKEDVREVFDKHETGLTKYFKYYVNQAKQELNLDLEYQMNQLHYKEWVKFTSQSKIVPVLATSDEVVNVFRKIAKQAYKQSVSENKGTIGPSFSKFDGATKFGQGKEELNVPDK